MFPLVAKLPAAVEVMLGGGAKVMLILATALVALLMMLVRLLMVELATLVMLFMALVTLLTNWFTAPLSPPKAPPRSKEEA